ncbi:MAG TPA: hypothetical protein VLL75_05230 [Vicinamibacteria bacterium]|nr:hypothetical protein [Vicinamibacteria bacterium]
MTAPSAATYRAGLHLVTVHPPESYPGLSVVRCGPAWLSWLILGEVGQTVTARGGEQMYGYVTPDGVRADHFVLHAGDRATVIRKGLPASLVEWRVERAAASRRRARR